MITVVVSGIGSISLFVGAMEILAIMWISVNERTAKAGLLCAVGVRRGDGGINEWLSCGPVLAETRDHDRKAV